MKTWLQDPPSNPKIRVNVWEREGIGEQGLFTTKSLKPGVPKNISLLKSTGEKAKYRYHDIDLSNLSRSMPASSICLMLTM